LGQYLDIPILTVREFLRQVFPDHVD
jgi:hypothetical protein